MYQLLLLYHKVIFSVICKSIRWHFDYKLFPNGYQVSVDNFCHFIIVCPFVDIFVWSFFNKPINWHFVSFHIKRWIRWQIVSSYKSGPIMWHLMRTFCLYVSIWWHFVSNCLVNTLGNFSDHLILVDTLYNILNITN